MKKKAFVSSVLVIVLCAAIIAGSTFALFTSETRVNVAVTAGTVKVVASYVEDSLTYTSTLPEGKLAESEARIEGSELIIERMVPGDVVSFSIAVENRSDVIIQYRTVILTKEDSGLLDALTVTVDGTDYRGGTAESVWKLLRPGETVANVPVTVALPEDTGDLYQQGRVVLTYLVEAVQANAETVDPELPEVDPEDIVIYNVGDLRDISARVADGETFAGQRIVLVNDLDLSDGSFTPIGTEENPFLGTFDGGDNTVSNLTLTAEGGAGLFGFAGAEGTPAVIRDLNVQNVTVGSDVSAGGIVGVLNGVAQHCTVTEATVSAGGSVGSIVGEALGASVIADCYAENVTLSDVSALSADGGAGSAGVYVGRASEELIKSNNSHLNVSVPGAVSVSTVEALQAAMSVDGHYVLGADLTITASQLMTIPGRLAGLYVTDGAKVTLDLNGHKITVEDSTAADYVIGIRVQNGALTIMGEGVIEHLGTGDIHIWAGSVANSVITLEGGTFVGHGETTLVYASGKAQDDCGEVRLLGGTYDCEDKGIQGYLNITNHGLGRVYLSGGVYVTFDIANDYDGNDRPYVTIPDGCSVVYVGDDSAVTYTAGE